jgi:hypothetical protein
MSQDLVNQYFLFRNVFGRVRRVTPKRAYIDVLATFQIPEHLQWHMLGVIVYGSEDRWVDLGDMPMATLVPVITDAEARRFIDTINDAILAATAASEPHLAAIAKHRERLKDALERAVNRKQE